MIKDEILAMQPGKELNSLVAEKVMGKKFPTVDEMKSIAENQWEVQPECVHFLMDFDAWKVDGEFHWEYRSPKYSTDISAAWEVVDKLKISVIPQSISAPNDMKYLARIEEDFGQEEIQVFAFTAPEAICKAALLAVMEELPKGIGTTAQA